MMEILGFIIRQYGAGNPATLRAVEEYWKELDKPKWFENHSNSLTEVLTDLNGLEMLRCIYTIKGERPYSSEYRPTDYGIFFFEDLGNELPSPYLTGVPGSARHRACAKT